MSPPLQNYNFCSDKETDEAVLLIDEVLKFPCIYKRKYPSSCNPNKCNCWNIISKSLKNNPVELKRKWKLLRRRFTKKKLNNKRLIEKLQFLLEDIKACDLPKRGWATKKNNLPMCKKSNLSSYSQSPTFTRNPNLIPVPISKSRTDLNEEIMKTSNENHGIPSDDDDIEIIEPFIEVIVIDDENNENDIVEVFDSSKITDPDKNSYFYLNESESGLMKNNNVHAEPAEWDKRTKCDSEIIDVEDYYAAIANNLSSNRQNASSNGTPKIPAEAGNTDDVSPLCYTSGMV